MSLLDDAKKIAVHRQRRGTVNDEEVELALAWLSSEITLTQANTVMAKGNYKSSNLTLCRFTYAFRKAYQEGLLKIYKKRGK